MDGANDAVLSSAPAQAVGSEEVAAEDLPDSMTVDEHVRLLLQGNPTISVKECRAAVHGRLIKMGVGYNVSIVYICGKSTHIAN